jgi:leucyl aminopeptidase
VVHNIESSATVAAAPAAAAAAAPAVQIAIVGKGLTFDSGGYNLKAGPGSMIELMKVRE